MRQKSILPVTIVLLAIAVIIFFLALKIFSFPANQSPSISGAASFSTNLTIQSLNNGLTVTVLDCADSSTISGATVRIYDNATAIVNSTTNSSGQLAVNNIAAGTYTVEGSISENRSVNLTAIITENAVTEATARIPPCAVTQPPAAGGGTRAFPSPQAALVIKKGIIGALPGIEFLSAYAGEKTSFALVVSNEGNVPLTDVKLEIAGLPKNGEIIEKPKNISLSGFTGALLLQGENTEGASAEVVKVVPQNIDEIPPGVQKVFYIEIFVPESTPPGNYTIIAQASSKETVFVKPIVLQVLSSEKKPAAPIFLGSQINSLRNNIAGIYDVALSLKEKGGDVSAALSLLDLADQSLAKADEFLSQHQFDSAKLHIENVRALIRGASEILSKVSIPYTNPYQTIIFVIIIGFVLLFTIVLYLKHEQKRTFNQLKDILDSIRRTRAERVSER